MQASAAAANAAAAGRAPTSIPRSAFRGLSRPYIVSQLPAANSAATDWYPRLSANDRQALEQRNNFTAHHLQAPALQKMGFGLRQKEYNSSTNGNNNRVNRVKNDNNNNRRNNLYTSLSDVVLVDGEIHCRSKVVARDGNYTVDCRALGERELIGAPVDTNDVPTAQNSKRLSVDWDASRSARANAKNYAKQLHSDATSGLDGLKARLKRNLVRSLFRGGMILRWYHFEDLLQRYMELTDGKPLDDWNDVVRLQEQPETADLMDSLHFYILCYSGMSASDAADRVRVNYALRQSRRGRSMLLKVIQDLRLLGSGGWLADKLFRKIAKHLLATRSGFASDRRTRGEVTAEVQKLQKQVDKRPGVLRKLGAAVTGTSTNGFVRNFGQRNRNDASSTSLGRSRAPLTKKLKRFVNVNYGAQSYGAIENVASRLGRQKP